MNVILQGDGRPFGVLEVDSRSEDEFIENDLAFLQGTANLLGMAIERDRHERVAGGLKGVHTEQRGQAAAEAARLGRQTHDVPAS